MSVSQFSWAFSDEILLTTLGPLSAVLLLPTARTHPITLADELLHMGLGAGARLSFQ